MCVCVKTNRVRGGERVFDSILTRCVKSIVLILRQGTEETVQGDKGRGQSERKEAGRTDGSTMKRKG